MATIKDVAKEAGLAVGTVSRVMNNRGYISEDARKRVREAMEKLKYQPNEMARSLQRRHSDLIGLIVPRIEHPYFAKLISMLEEAAYNKGKRLLILNSKGILGRENKYLEICERNKAEGIILCNGNPDIMSRLKGNIPVVTIERKSDGGDSSIECNNYQGGVLAAEHLTERGCRKLLHIKGFLEQNMPADRRGDGFTDTCMNRGLVPKVIPVPLKEYRLENSEEFFTGKLDIIKESDGVFISDDVLAAMAMRVCLRHGIRIPEDLKVVGFDNVNICTLLTPSLTTVNQPLREMAETAVNLVEMLSQKKPVPKNTVFPVELIRREST